MIFSDAESLEAGITFYSIHAHRSHRGENQKIGSVQSPGQAAPSTQRRLRPPVFRRTIFRPAKATGCQMHPPEIKSLFASFSSEKEDSVFSIGRMP
jgi:hypothetical protein